jgi:hypothetical protein
MVWRCSCHRQFAKDVDMFIPASAYTLEAGDRRRSAARSGRDGRKSRDPLAARARLVDEHRRIDGMLAVIGRAKDVVGMVDRSKTMTTDTLPALRPIHVPWNKGRIVGHKRPLLPKHVWSIRVRLEIADNRRDLALFNMAVDSKLRGCDLVRLKVNDVYAAGSVKDRASVTQSKTR